MAHMVKCVKLGREAEGLDEPPFDNELGQKIYNNVSKLAWEQWGGPAAPLIVVDAHLYGATCGFIVGAALCLRIAIIRHRSRA